MKYDHRVLHIFQKYLKNTLGMCNNYHTPRHVVYIVYIYNTYDIQMKSIQYAFENCSKVVSTS